jgi:hypothetical protein
MAQDKVLVEAVLNTVKKLNALQIAGCFLTRRATISFQTKVSNSKKLLRSQ